MKIIRISTDNEVSFHDFPEGNYSAQNHALRELIGNGCQIYEHVMPRRLYTELHIRNQATDLPGQCVSMLIDEEGMLKENEPNMLGSYLYESDRHGYPIMGNILLVGEKLDEDGIDFCGIEDSVFRKLAGQIEEMINKIEEEELDI